MKRKEAINNAVKSATACVIYARFSSSGQKEISIEGQLRVCKESAEKMGLNIVGTYCDRAKSGTTDKRPQFQQMIADAQSKRFRYVICYSTSRFARNRADAARYKRELRSYGIKVIFTQEKFDDSPAGNLSEAIFEALDEFYSENLSISVKRGYYDSAVKHLYLGTRSLGYVRGEDGKHQIEPSEAILVRRIYDEYESGKLLADIIRDLNNDGYRTTQGRQFTRNSLRTILRNEAYIGVYKMTDQIRDENVIPPIIGEDQFNRVQYMLEKRKRPRCKRDDQTIYLLTGKSFCGLCGEPMTGESARSKSGEIYHYYSCVEMRKHRCKKKRVSKDKLEGAVSSAVVETLMDDAFIENTIKLFEEYQQTLGDNSEFKSLEDNLKDIQRKKKNLLTAIENGIVTDTTLSRMKGLEEEERRVQASIEQYEFKDRRIPESIVRLFLDRLRSGNIKDSRYREKLIDIFVEKVFVYEDHFTIAFRMSDREETISLEEAEGVRVSCVTSHDKTHRRTQFYKCFCLVEFPLK